MKYSKKLADKIVELYATGNHTIVQICDHVSINVDTYYDWRAKKAEFSEALKGVENRRLDSLGDLARSGLSLLLTGHEYEETTTEYVEGKDKQGNVKPKIKSQKKIKKFVMPNPTAVIFTLTNRSPEDWKRQQVITHTGEDGGPVQTALTIKVGYGEKDNDQDDQD